MITEIWIIKIEIFEFWNHWQYFFLFVKGKIFDRRNFILKVSENSLIKAIDGNFFFTNFILKIFDSKNCILEVYI